MKDLLICVAHHAAPDRLQYLLRVLEAFAEYELSLDILIDTNAAGLDVRGKNITTVHHTSFDHPFFLTWMHRRHMKDRIEDYHAFAYFEDDILLPFENFDHYQTRFGLLWPDYAPGFIRVEKYKGEEYAVDVTKRQPCFAVRTFHTALRQPYHGFWIMPQKALKETMTPDFVRLSDSREAAASYPMWGLGKTVLVQIDDEGKVIRECFAYHLSNSYASCPTSPHGKIKVSDIFL